MGLKTRYPVWAAALLILSSLHAAAALAREQAAAAATTQEGRRLGFGGSSPEPVPTGQSEGPLYGKLAPCKECEGRHKSECCCCPCSKMVDTVPKGEHKLCEVPKCIGCQAATHNVLQVTGSSIGGPGST